MNQIHSQFKKQLALGTCTLVGAGPGDPELLTIKAVNAIKSATLLLVDDLVNDAVLAYASPTARIVHVGKRGGCKSTPQAFIDKLMINAVHEGERVVRLKGGDPFIFGRGGEEVEHLREAGIDAVAIGFIHAWAHPAHEQRAREILPYPLVEASNGDVKIQVRDRRCNFIAFFVAFTWMCNMISP